MNYTGKEDKAPGTGAGLRHYIGVLDPATGQLQVVEAKKMVIRGSVRAREASDDAMRGVSVKNVSYSCLLFLWKVGMPRECCMLLTRPR